MNDLRNGDIVLNGYQSEPRNIYLIVGSTSRKTGMYSRTSYYSAQPIIKGQLVELSSGKSLFSKTDNKLQKIGHINIKEVLSAAISEALNDPA